MSSAGPLMDQAADRTFALNPSFDLAREAARNAAGLQHHPTGALYVVATPIGNLADISLRALHVLGLVDAIACEDTRHTQAMLRHYGIERPLLAVHQHNEAQAALEVIRRLQGGQRVACVSDAGTPAISDPGARLVAAVRQAGLGVVPLPGPSSLSTVLSVAGLGIDGPVVFAGFLPTKAGEREQRLAQLAHAGHAVVLLEAPHRIEALAAQLAGLGDRAVTVGRELTKQFEQIVTLPAAQLPHWLGQDAQRTRGEFALVLHPQPQQVDPWPEHERVLTALLEHVPLKTAVQLAAQITGAPRNELYERALRLRPS
jgi:16S rRNA (cytidine1402-2'-O)-methyltransferase